MFWGNIIMWICCLYNYDMHVAGFCFISGAMTRTRKGKNTIKLDQPGAISNISQTPNKSIRVEVGVWNRRLHQWLLGAAILILDISYVWKKKCWSIDISWKSLLSLSPHHSTVDWEKKSVFIFIFPQTSLCIGVLNSFPFPSVSFSVFTVHCCQAVVLWRHKEELFFPCSSIIILITFSP